MPSKGHNVFSPKISDVLFDSILDVDNLPKPKRRKNKKVKAKTSALQTDLKETAEGLDRQLERMPFFFPAFGLSMLDPIHRARIKGAVIASQRLSSSGKKPLTSCKPSWFAPQVPGQILSDTSVVPRPPLGPLIAPKPPPTEQPFFNPQMIYDGKPQSPLTAIQSPHIAMSSHSPIKYHDDMDRKNLRIIKERNRRDAALEYELLRCKKSKYFNYVQKRQEEHDRERMEASNRAHNQKFNQKRQGESKRLEKAIEEAMAKETYRQAELDLQIEKERARFGDKRVSFYQKYLGASEEMKMIHENDTYGPSSFPTNYVASVLEKQKDTHLRKDKLSRDMINAVELFLVPLKCDRDNDRRERKASKFPVENQQALREEKPLQDDEPRLCWPNPFESMEEVTKSREKSCPRTCPSPPQKKQRFEQHYGTDEGMIHGVGSNPNGGNDSLKDGGNESLNDFKSSGVIQLNMEGRGSKCSDQFNHGDFDPLP